MYDRFSREFTATVSQSSSTSCSTSFLALLVIIAHYNLIVSLLLFAFLSKRNGASCNSADYLDSIYFFSHLNLGACAGFALANCDWLGRTIAFYQVFFQRAGWLWANDVSVPRKVTPGLPGWIFLYSAQASFSWPRVDLARLLRRAYSRSVWIIFFEFVKSVGFVSLSGKASLVSISAAILFLRSWHVYFPLEIGRAHV